MMRQLDGREDPFARSILWPRFYYFLRQRNAAKRRPHTSLSGRVGSRSLTVSRLRPQFRDNRLRQRHGAVFLAFAVMYG